MFDLEINEQDIKDAKQHLGANLKSGDSYVFQIVALEEKGEGDKRKRIVKTKVIGSDQDGLSYSLFYSLKQMPQLVKLLLCFFSEQELTNKPDMSKVIGECFTATANDRQHDGKTYSELKNFARHSDAPSFEGIKAPTAKEKTSQDVF